MKREFKLYLKDIVDCADSIEEFIGSMDFEEFIEDNKTKSAVVLKLENIGEASKNIPAHLREKYPYIKWSSMSKMRDKITHGYFEVDYEIVWNVVKEKLLKIKEDVTKILADLEQQEEQHFKKTK